MKIVRTSLIYLAIVISMGVFSAQSYAGPAADIDNVLAAIIAAEDAIQGGAEGSEAYKLIKVAIGKSSEINVGDKMSSAIARANGKLKKARGAAKKGELQVAEEHLKAGYNAFAALKKLL